MVHVVVVCVTVIPSGVLGVVTNTPELRGNPADTCVPIDIGEPGIDAGVCTVVSTGGGQASHMVVVDSAAGKNISWTVVLCFGAVVVRCLVTAWNVFRMVVVVVLAMAATFEASIVLTSALSCVSSCGWSVHEGPDPTRHTAYIPSREINRLRHPEVVKNLCLHTINQLFQHGC